MSKKVNIGIRVFSILVVIGICMLLSAVATLPIWAIIAIISKLNGTEYELLVYVVPFAGLFGTISILTLLGLRKEHKSTIAGEEVMEEYSDGLQ